MTHEIIRAHLSCYDGGNLSFFQRRLLAQQQQAARAAALPPLPLPPVGADVVVIGGGGRQSKWGPIMTGSVATSTASSTATITATVPGLPGRKRDFDLEEELANAVKRAKQRQSQA